MWAGGRSSVARTSDANHAIVRSYLAQTAHYRLACARSARWTVGVRADRWEEPRFGHHADDPRAEGLRRLVIRSLFVQKADKCEWATCARQDALATTQIADDRLIVLAPAGRESLFRVSQRYGEGSDREFEVMTTPGSDFFRSEFATRWRYLLRSVALADLARRTGYRVVLLPRWQLIPYLHVLQVPDWLGICKPDHSVISLLSRLSVFVTDYSSYSADVAFIGKPVIYYSSSRRRSRLCHRGGKANLISPATATDPCVLTRPR